MPGNEIAEKVHNFFEQDRLSQGQHQPQITSGNWSALNNNIWLNNQRQNAPPHFSQQKNYDVHSSDAGKDSENINVRQSTRMHPGSNFSQLTLRPEITRSQQLNTNGFLHDSQGFQIRSNEAEFLEEDILPDRHNLALRNSTILQSQQGRAQEHNPGITSISERLESIKAPVNFDFLGSQHQLMRGQQSGISQPQPRQQPGLNDLPLWQQHLVYRQMQEIQRQRRLQQLDQEARQQNSSSQLSAVAKPIDGDPLPHVNGASIHNASSILWPGEIVHQMGVDPKVPIGSQAFMVGNVNWARSGSSTVQGFPNGFVLSHDQGQGFRSMGFLPQQLDQSSYGASIGSTRNAMIRPSNPYSNFQGISHSGPDMLAKTGGSQVAKAVMQSNALSSFQADESSMFPEQVCIEDGVSVSKQNIHGRNFFGHAPNVLQNPNSGIVPGNFQQLGSLPRNSQFQEFHGRQERAGWPGSSEEKESLQVGPSQGLVNLDLTEEKVLYNTGDSIWDPAGGYVQNSQLEGADFLNMFPSVQSGSWSALMQSAVAEASSSDTGLQDEWSGLSFQKTELSTGNPQLSDSGKQPTVWGDQNMPTAPSQTSRPFPLFDESNMSPNGQPASGFEQTTPKFMYEQSERAEGEPQAIHGVTSESLQQSTGLPNKWLDHSPQQKHLVEGKLPTHVHSENTAEGGWASQIYERTGSVVRSEDMDLDVQNMHSPWVPQQRASSYKANSSQPCNKSNEWNINESLLPNGDNLQSCDNAQGHIYRDDNRVTVPFSNKGVGMEQVKRGTGSPQVHSEDDSGNSFAPVPSSNMLKINQENNQQTLNSRQLEGKHTIVDSSAEFKGNENVGRFQNQPSKHLQFQDPSMNCSDRASSERHDRKREKSHQKDSSNDNFISNNVYHLQQTVTGGGGERQSYWLSGSDSRPVVGANQRSSGQVARKPSVRRFQYHPMGNLDVDVTQTTMMEHATHSQAVSQLVSRESKAQGAGYYGHPKFVGTVASGNVVDMEKGHMAADSQSNPKGVEDALSKGVVPGFNSTVSASFDGSIAFYNPNKRTVQTSPNMLELLNKVDQPRETNLMRFGSSKMSEPAGSNSSAADLQQNQSPASQGFGLRLAPPSQRIPISKLSLSSQTSQTVNDLNSQHIDPEVGYRGQTFLPTPVTGQSLPSAYEISQREHWGSKSSLTGHTVESHSNFQENASTTISTGLHYSQDQLEHQQISSSSKQITTDQPTNISSEVHFRQTLDTHDEQLAESASASALAFSDKFLSCERSSDSSHSQPTNINSSHLDPPPVSQASVTLGTSQQGSFSTMLHNVWTDRSAQQCVPGGTHKASPSLVSSIPSSSSSLEPTSWIGQKVDEHKNIGKGGSCPSEFGPCSINAQQFVSGDEQPVKDNSLKHTLPERDRVNRTRFPFSPANFPSTAEYNLPPQTVSGSLFQSLGQEPLAKHPSNANSVTSSSAVVHLHQDIGTESHVQDSSLLSQKEHSSLQQSPASDRNFEVLKNSGKPSGSLHNYSLLNQMQAMKSAGTDPNMKNVKRLKVEEYGTDGLQVAPTTSHRFMYGYSTIATDPIDNDPKAEQDAPRPSADGKRLSFSMEGAENPNVNRDLPSKDMITGGNDPQNHSSSHFSLTSLPSSLRVAEYSQRNPQVAPSWFGQFGTYKNEQILDMYDGLGAPRDSAKATSQQYLVGSASGSAHGAVEEGHADIASHVGTMVQSTSSIVAASENMVLTQSSLPDTGHQSFTLVRLKKRKILAPWHKEVVQSSHKIRSISMAELEWAHVANRRIEKIDDEAEMMDDGPSMSRQRRRLILTTQLMQQLIRAVPTSILSAEASSDYESVTYLVAKVALRDACSLISCPGSDSNVQPYNENSTSGRPNTSERAGGQIISKFVEDYIGRTKKLENDLLRLNERAFFLDLRVECQELEKFFIINRFARYHGRSQSDGVSSLSATDVAAVRKPFPQRYVTALSMPRKLPEGMLCLSL